MQFSYFSFYVSLLSSCVCRQVHALATREMRRFLNSAELFVLLADGFETNRGFKLRRARQTIVISRWFVSTRNMTHPHRGSACTEFV